ncbi:MAG: heme ABC exporter ATP-binding protein CcmA [Pseudomonadota bacterium]
MLLNVESLMIDRGERRIIRDLSFQVRSSEALLLRGRNGAGKTTLIRAIAGFLAPTSGKLTLEGGHEEMTLAEQCHYIGHLNGVKANMTVSENLGFWGRYLEPDADRAAQQDRLETALETFDLLALEDIPAGYLSAGQKRRVGLARLKLADRPLWLLDEPTVSLDTASVAILAEAVKSHVASGGLAIAATHIPLGLETARTLELVPNLNLDSTGAEADAEAW